MNIKRWQKLQGAILDSEQSIELWCIRLKSFQPSWSSTLLNSTQERGSLVTKKCRIKGNLFLFLLTEVTSVLVNFFQDKL